MRKPDDITLDLNRALLRLTEAIEEEPRSTHDLMTALEYSHFVLKRADALHLLHPLMDPRPPNKRTVGDAVGTVHPLHPTREEA